MSVRINFQIGNSDEIITIRTSEVPRVGESVSLDAEKVKGGAEYADGEKTVDFDVISVHWVYLPVSKHPYHLESVANVQVEPA